MSKHNTIRLSDTADQWARRVHVNVRGEKVTTVYRWKSRDGRDHTQRMTLDDNQTARLMAALVNAQAVVLGDNKKRINEFAAKMAKLID